MALATDAGERVRERLLGELVTVPAHFDIEGLSALRQLLRGRRLDLARTAQALEHIALLNAERVPLAPMLAEAFALRDRFSAHDAFYVVLARRRVATLATADSRLARAAAGHAKVVLVAA